MENITAWHSSNKQYGLSRTNLEITWIHDIINVLLKLCLEKGKVFIETICRLPIPLSLSNSVYWMEPWRVDVRTPIYASAKPEICKTASSTGYFWKILKWKIVKTKNNFHWDIETCETFKILLKSRNKCWSNWNGMIGKLPPSRPENCLYIPNISLFAPRSLTTNSDFGSQSHLRFYWCHLSV